jgi:hypothetical protein
MFPPAQRASLQRHRGACKARHFPEISGFSLIDREGGGALRLRDSVTPGKRPGSAATSRICARIRACPWCSRKWPWGAWPAASRCTSRSPCGTPTRWLRRGGHGTPRTELMCRRSSMRLIWAPAGSSPSARSDDGRLVLRRPAQPERINQTLSNNPMHMRIEAGEREGTIRYEAAIDQGGAGVCLQAGGKLSLLRGGRHCHT